MPKRKKGEKKKKMDGGGGGKALSCFFLVSARYQTSWAFTQERSNYDEYA